MWQYCFFYRVKVTNETNVFLTDYWLETSVTSVKRNALNRLSDCEQNFMKPFQVVCEQAHVVSLLVS